MAGADQPPMEALARPEPAVDGRAITLRSVALGVLMCVAIGLVGPYWTFYLHSSTLFLDYSVGGAMFFVFVLVLVVNGALARVVPSVALRPGELVVITAMAFVGGAIVTMGLVGYLIPNITAPYYLAAPHNEWSTRLWPHLKGWMSPLDPDGRPTAIIHFFMGIGDDPIPWQVWVKPLLLWSVLLAALYACMTSLMVIMRKQWIDYEHLSYPIAQVPEELCAAAASPWRSPSILASGLFWGGFAVPFFIGTLKGLNGYYPRVPFLTIARWVPLGTSGMSLTLYLSFAVLGFTFLIPNRVAFSLWFLNVVSLIFRYYMRDAGLELKENLSIYGAESNPIMAHQCMGAMIVFIVSGFWFSRRHLRRVLNCALGRDDTGYDADEPSSYRTALVMLIVGAGTMAVWFWRGGLGPGYSMIFVVVALLIFYGLTRVVAQCGVAVTIAPMIAPSFMTSTFGTANISHSGLGLLSMSWVWCSDIRTSVMGSSAHGMYLARRRGRHLLWLLLLAAAVTYATACLFTVWLGYRRGAANLHDWFFISGPKYLFQWTLGALESGQSTNVPGLIWTGVGAAIMVGLVVAQRSLFWWPVHPVGFIICSVGWTDTLWASILLAWAIKVVVVKVGGQALFRKARRFFLGMILGQFTVAGVWAIIDTFTGKIGNSIFWI